MWTPWKLPVDVVSKSAEDDDDDASWWALLNEVRQRGVQWDSIESTARLRQERE